MADPARSRMQLLVVVGATGVLMSLATLSAWLRGAEFRPVT